MIERMFEAVVAPAAVAAASRWARDLADELHLTREDTHRLDLVLTEAVQNIVDHSGVVERESPLVLHARAAGSGLHVAIFDEADAFNPLTVPPPELPESIEAAVPGGLGVPIIREFTDRFWYDRQGNRNCLNLEFDLAHVANDTARGHRRIARGRERRLGGRPVRFPLKRADGGVVERDERSSHDRRLTGFISRSEIFRDVAYAQVEEIVASFPVKDLADRTVLLRPGDRNEHALIVLRGTLRVRFDSLDSLEYVEIGEGGCVGEMSIIDGKPISAFVVAEPGCRLLLIDAASFLGRIVVIPRVARNLVSTLSERMRRSNDIIIDQFKARVELEHLQRELRYARTIQESMLPREPLFAGRRDIDCTGTMRAAKNVGGDFYDAFLLAPHLVLVAVGDVCNKGLPAALFMVRALTTLRSEVSQPGPDVARHMRDAIERVNRHLNLGNEAQQFLTLFCGVVDLERGTLTYVNAGHNPTLLAREDGAFDYLSEPVDPIVGMIDGLKFEAAEVPMPAGSTLVLYSDGVTEAEDPSGAMFGEERLRALVREAPRGSAKALVNGIVAEVDRFAAGTPQSDDITVLALHILPRVAG